MNKLFLATVLVLAVFMGAVTAADYQYFNDEDSDILWILDNASAATLKTYYVRASGTYAAAPTQVFEIYDDFNDASLNTSMWTCEFSGTCTESGSTLQIGGGRRVRSVNTYGYNYTWLGRVYTDTSNNYAWGWNSGTGNYLQVRENSVFLNSVDQSCWLSGAVDAGYNTYEQWRNDSSSAVYINGTLTDCGYMAVTTAGSYYWAVYDWTSGLSYIDWAAMAKRQPYQYANVTSLGGGEYQVDVYTAFTETDYPMRVPGITLTGNIRVTDETNVTPANVINVTFKALSNKISSAAYNVSFTNGTASYYYADKTGEFTTEISENATGTFTYRLNATNHYYKTGTFNAAELSKNVTMIATDISVTTAFTVQEIPITVSTAWATIKQFTVNFTGDSEAYAMARIETNSSGSGTAQCRILIDGVDYNSQATRSLTAGSLGQFIIITDDYNVTGGQIETIELECRKQGGSNYIVDNADILVQDYYDQSENENVSHEYVNSTNRVITTTWSPIANYTFTTTTKNVSDKRNLGWMINYRYTTLYSADANITAQWALDGDFTYCHNKTRSGLSGASGSVASSCLFNDLSRNTTYTATLYASTDTGTQTINDLSGHSWELLEHIGGFNGTIKEGISYNDTQYKALANITIKNIVGGSYVVDVFASINTLANTTAGTATFYLADTSNSSIIARDLETYQLGNLFLFYSFNVSGVSPRTYTLYGECGSGDCWIDSLDLTALMTDQANVSVNNFQIIAWDYYAGQPLTNFSVTVDGATINTTNGTVVIPRDEAFENVTVNSITYFANNTVNHDTSTVLNQSLIRWTAINAVTANNGTAISFFNITLNGTLYATTGFTAYIPLFNTTTNVTFNNTQYSILIRELNASLYLENYTFEILLLNTFNISFYNETTNQIINTTIFYEIISDSEVRNGTTTNGSVQETVLTPGTYQIRYYREQDVPRNYYVTLLPQSYEQLRLYLIDDSESETYQLIVQDGTNARCSNETVSLLRYYVDINGYRTVSMSKTNTLGEAVFFVEPISNPYKFSFTGSCGSFVSEPTVIVNTVDTYVVTQAQSYLTSIEGIENVFYNLTYNNNTYTYVFTWADSSNLIVSGCLEVTKLFRGIRTSVYSACSVANSGSLIYTVNQTDINNTIYFGQGKLTTNTEFSNYFTALLEVNNKTSFQVLGSIGLFMGALMIVALILFAGSSAVTVSIGAVGALAILVYAGIVFAAWTTVIGLVIVAVVIAAKVRNI